MDVFDRNHHSYPPVIDEILAYQGTLVIPLKFVKRLSLFWYQGRTALHVAAFEGHIEVASTLISKATLLLHQVDKDGRTPLHLASANGHKDLLTIMIGQGAEIDAKDNVSDTSKVSRFSPMIRKIFVAFYLRKLKKLTL